MDLSDAYENGAYIPGAAEFPPRWTAEAAAFREALGDRAEIDIETGPRDRQRMDLFRPEGAAEGLVVFIHGGYWRRFDKSYWSHFAAGPLARGWAVAMPSYTLAPEARISSITEEIAQAVTSAANRVQGPVIINGHSAGGHLSARMRCRPVSLPWAMAQRITRIVPISPVADLRPLLQTAMNDDLRLDADEAASESPVLCDDLRDIETTIWVGADERPAFLDQARCLADAWPDARLQIAPGLHHFDILDGLTQTESALTRSLFD